MSKINKIKDLIDTEMFEGRLTNDNLVEIIEHSADYLNLQKVSDYAKREEISKSAVYRYRDIRVIRGVKFVVDND